MSVHWPVAPSKTPEDPTTWPSPAESSSGDSTLGLVEAFKAAFPDAPVGDPDPDPLTQANAFDAFETIPAAESEAAAAAAAAALSSPNPFRKEHRVYETVGDFLAMPVVAAQATSSSSSSDTFESKRRSTIAKDVWIVNQGAAFEIVEKARDTVGVLKRYINTFRDMVRDKYGCVYVNTNLLPPESQPTHFAFKRTHEESRQPAIYKLDGLTDLTEVLRIRKLKSCVPQGIAQFLATIGLAWADESRGILTSSSASSTSSSSKSCDTIHEKDESKDHDEEAAKQPKPKTEASLSSSAFLTTIVQYGNDIIPLLWELRAPSGKGSEIYVHPDDSALLDRFCYSCVKQGARLRKCQGCNRVCYCNRDCQKMDRETHMFACKMTDKEKQAVEKQKKEQEAAEEKKKQEQPKAEAATAAPASAQLPVPEPASTSASASLPAATAASSATATSKSVPVVYESSPLAQRSMRHTSDGVEMDNDFALDDDKESTRESAAKRSKTMPPVPFDLYTPSSGPSFVSSAAADTSTTTTTTTSTTSSSTPAPLQQPPQHQQCSACGKPPQAGKKLRKCTRCLKVAYCDANCQLVGWERDNHKSVCTKSTSAVQ